MTVVTAERLEIIRALTAGGLDNRDSWEQAVRENIECNIPDFTTGADDATAGLRMSRYECSPIVSRFHKSTAQIRVLEGRYNSGKSISAIVDILAFQTPKQPLIGGVRRKQLVGVFRRTMPALRRTFLRALVEGAPVGWEIDYKKADDRVVATCRAAAGEFWEVEIELMSLEQGKDQEKMRSLPLSGILACEYPELPPWVVDTGRIGRQVGVHNELGWIILEGNSPSRGHWIEKLIPAPTKKQYFDFADCGFSIESSERVSTIEVNKDEDGREIRRQVLDGRRSIDLFITESGESEWAEWFLRLAGKAPDYYNQMKMTRTVPEYERFGLGWRVDLLSGKMIYDSWSEAIHTREEVPPVPGSPVHLGADGDKFGAVILGQKIMNESGQVQLRIMDEWDSNGEDPLSFGKRVGEGLLSRWGSYPLGGSVMDMAGFSSATGRGGSYADAFNTGLKASGVRLFAMRRSVTNDWDTRVSLVNNRFTRVLARGQPSIVVSRHRCPLLCKAIPRYIYAQDAKGGFDGKARKKSADPNTGLGDAVAYLCMAIGDRLGNVDGVVREAKVPPVTPIPLGPKSAVDGDKFDALMTKFQ